MFTWERYSDKGYECSSRGDKRFSAFYAKLPDGRSIEDAYQLDIKGYRIYGNSYTLGKGKPPLNKMSKETLYLEYRNLWVMWAEEHPDMLLQLCTLAKNKILTDCFATTEINQAHALCDILNELLPQLSRTESNE